MLKAVNRIAPSTNGRWLGKSLIVRRMPGHGSELQGERTVKKNREQLIGKVTISRAMNGRDDRPFRISIEDELSGCRVVEVFMTATDFANAIGGLGFVPCVFEYNTSGVIGKKREVKDEIVTMPKSSYGRSEAEARNAVKPFEKDGWVVHSLSDCWNGHRRIRNTDNFRVGFIRWVDVPCPATADGKESE